MRTAFTKMTKPVVAPARSHAFSRIGLRDVLRRVIGRKPNANDWSRAHPPPGMPSALMPRLATAADSYERDTPVWAYIAGAWLPADRPQGAPQSTRPAQA